MSSGVCRSRKRNCDRFCKGDIFRTDLNDTAYCSSFLLVVEMFVNRLNLQSKIKQYLKCLFIFVSGFERRTMTGTEKFKVQTPNFS